MLKTAKGGRNFDMDVYKPKEHKIDRSKPIFLDSLNSIHKENVRNYTKVTEVYA